MSETKSQEALPPKPLKQAAPVTHGSKLEYRINAPLTLETMLKLADIVRQCRGNGTDELHLLDAKGRSLDVWRESFGHPPVLVDGQSFHVLAEHYGIF